MRILVDTGAAFSVINKRIFDCLKPKPQLRPSHIQLKSASGDHINVLGEAELLIRFNSKLSLKHTFIVTDNLSRNMILGRPFLAQNNCRIYYDLKCIKILTEYIPLTNDTLIAAIVRLSKPVRLKPFTTTQLPATIKNNHYVQTGDICEISECSEGYLYNEPMVHVSNSLFTVNKNRLRNVPIVITNNTSKVFRLRRGTAVGRVTKLQYINEIQQVPGSDHLAPTELEDSSIHAPLEHLPRLKKIFSSNKDVFSTHDLDLGCYPFEKVSIPTTGPPVKMRQYRIPFADRPLLQEKIDKLLEAKVIRPSHSEYNAPCLLVNKRNDATGAEAKRLVIDYRKLNKQIKQSSFPLPRLDDMLASLNGARYFSSLDLSNSYFQIQLKDEDTHKTSFSVFNSSYEFLRLPMGMNISPPKYQSIMTKVIKGCEHFAMVYLDDILLFSRTLDEHFRHIEIILQRIRDNCLKLKAKKCFFLKEEIKFLGHVINSSGILPDKDKITALRTLPYPKNVRDVRIFLGATNFYRRFLGNFAYITAPLTELLKKNNKFIWTPECSKSFDTILHKLENVPLLAHPQINLPYRIYVDASNRALGCVISQSPTGKVEDEKPLHFISQKLNKAQQSYSTIMLESLAVLTALRKFHPYIYSSKFTILTDHKPLCKLLTGNFENKFIQRIALELGQYNCDIQYWPGAKNIVADFLSRPSLDGDNSRTQGDSSKENVISYASTGSNSQVRVNTDSVPQDLGHDLVSDDKPTINIINSDEIDPTQIINTDHVPQPLETSPLPTSLEFDMKEEQHLDGDLSKLISRVKAQTLSVAEKRRFLIKDDKLYFISNADGEEPLLRLYVPKQLKQRVLQEFHNLGHPGSRKLYMAIYPHFYWPNLYKDTVNYVLQCIPCQSINLKSIQTPVQEPLIPTAPFHQISCDGVGPYPPTLLNNKYIIYFVCEYSGWVEAVPAKELTAEAVLNAFYECIFFRFGSALSIKTDNGRCFIAKAFQDSMKELGIHHIRISPYNSCANGKNERVHGTVRSHLVKLIGENPQQWDLVLNVALGAIRFNPSDATGMSPYYLIHGKSPILPITKLLGQHEKYRGDEFHKEMLERNHKIYCKAFMAIQKSRKKRNERINRDRKIVTFKENDAVYYRNFNRSSKLTAPWRPYFNVVKVLSPTSLLIKNQLDSKTVRCHISSVRLANIAEWPRPQNDTGRLRNCRYVVPFYSSSEENHVSDHSTMSDFSDIEMQGSQYMPQITRASNLDKSNSVIRTDSDSDGDHVCHPVTHAKRKRLYTRSAHSSRRQSSKELRDISSSNASSKVCNNDVGSASANHETISASTDRFLNKETSSTDEMNLRDLQIRLRQAANDKKYAQDILSYRSTDDRYTGSTENYNAQDILSYRSRDDHYTGSTEIYTP